MAEKYLSNECYANTYSLFEYHENGFEDMEQYLRINSCGYCDEVPDLIPVYRRHGRQDYFFSYIYSGTMFFHSGDKNMTCSAGDVLFFAPSEPQIYRYDCHSHLSNYWVHFTGFGAAQLLGLLDIPTGKPFHIGYIPEIEQLVKKIISEINNSRSRNTFYAVALFAEILALINKKKSEDLLLNIPHSSSICQTALYIQENLTEKINLKELASMCFLSVNRYTIVFKKLIGTTPHEYIIGLRLQKAIELLKNTDWTIGKVSSAIGYSDSLYFSRLFKKYYHVSPSEFRTMLRDKEY